MLKHIALGAALALLLAGPALAQDRPLKRDPCALYRANAAAESMMADGYGRVCKLLGPTRLTQACMDYYMLLTNPILHLSDKGKAARAAECERSMPGGSTLVQTGCAPGADCATADDSGGNLPAPAPAANDDAGMPAPSVGPTTGSSDTMECGNGAECRPPPDSEIVTDEENAAGLDLAFWNSIKDSTSPDLFRAYLDQFPKGVFRAIAEDRLKTLAGGAATPPAPAAAPGPAPQAAAGRDDALAEFGRAEAIMNRAYDMDASRWGEAAQKAVPLYLAAAKGGVAKAWMALGDLYENGIGVSVDETRAVDDFLRAGRAGLADGYVRALMLFDQRGKKDRYIETFLAFYRVAPTPALGSFDSVSSKAPSWLQSFLAERGFYRGAIDGQFGSGSQAALAAYLAAIPPPPAAAPAAPPAEDADADLARTQQRELARVGCYQAAIDGKWGWGSTHAMEVFNHWNGSDLPTDRPSQAGVRALRAQTGPVCGVD